VLQTMTMSQNPALKFVILMPVRDDWDSASELLRRLDQVLSPSDCTVDIFMVDDSSSTKCNTTDFQGAFSVLRTIRVLRLRRNLGHQRAIAIGLACLQEHSRYDAVLVMDADGEDTPQGVLDLLNAFKENDGQFAIFGERARRSESLIFRIFYHFYRHLHRALTGVRVRVGNFSILPFAYLTTLVAMSELWNHYAAAVFRSRLSCRMIPIPRGSRIAGASKMNFVSLVSHGLSAISVFGDIVGVRLLIASLMGSALSGLGIILVIVIRIFTNRAIPGWATYATGALAIIMIQFITVAASFTFFVLSSRTNLGFVPLRDYSLFVEEAAEIYCQVNSSISARN
jgi:glycosyltransferase involved in cell wall biosynthesis